MDTILIKEKLGARPIVLVGMMGCGKSHVGKVLGQALGAEFYDVDHVIEEKQGMSISEIFDQRGEMFFRDAEARIMSELIDRGTAVISSGGGALIRESTLRKVLGEAVSIWINTDVDVLLRRLAGDTTRPLLQEGDARNKLLSLLDERLPLYGQADIYVENNGDEADVMNEIGRALEEYL